MIAFKLENPILRNEFHKYFSIKIRNWGWDYNKNKYTMETAEVSSETCTREHFDE